MNLTATPDIENGMSASTPASGTPARAIARSEALYSRLADLADPTRTRLLSILDHGSFTVAELTVILELPQSTVSRHLRILVDGNWVSIRRDGPRRFYSLSLSEEGVESQLWSLHRREFSSTATCTADAERMAQALEARRAHSQAFFDRSVDRWDEVRTRIFGSDVELGAALGLLNRDWTAADLGCGTGKTTVALAPFVQHVVAVDASAAMCAATRARALRHSNVEVRNGRLEALPIDAATLDIALLVLVLHHVAEPSAVLAEAARVLRPGGRLLVMEMQAHNREDLVERMGHVWNGFEAQQLRTWGQKAALREIDSVRLPARSDVDGPPLFLWIAERIDA